MNALENHSVIPGKSRPHSFEQQLHLLDNSKITDDQYDGGSCPCHDLRIENSLFSNKYWKKYGRYCPHDKLCDPRYQRKKRISHPLNRGTCNVKSIKDGQADAHDCEIIIGNL